MAKCTNCHKGLNSSYIRINSTGSLKKIGFFCSNCTLHYDLNQKLYTVNEKLYTVSTNYLRDKKSHSIANSVNLPTNAPNIENSILSDHDKLYNCRSNIQKKRRVRSVVRISRRSSEPQVMGSKPTGPAVKLPHFGNCNQLSEK
jgi:hypothetical protein